MMFKKEGWWKKLLPKQKKALKSAWRKELSTKSSRISVMILVDDIVHLVGLTEAIYQA